MALFHLHVTQVKRSAGQSIVTSAAYRAGEKLYSEYYGEVSDYTHKGGVVCTDILLPPQATGLAALLTGYYEGRNAGAWSCNAKIGNLKNFAEAVNTSLKAKRDRLNELKELLRLVDLYRDTKPVYDELQGIKWKGKREKFELEHEKELRTFHMARRKLDKHRSPTGKIPAHAWEQEQARLQQEYKAEYEQYKPIQDDLWKLQQVKRNADAAIRQQEQTRQKRRETER